MTERELAWAAGLFEGEGTVRINAATKRNLGHLVVSVVNTDRQVVEFFHSRWAGYFKRATGLRPDQREAWVWVIASRKAAAFLVEIRPFVVTDRVSEKIRVGLEFQAQKARPLRVNRDEYGEEQWIYYMWMKELNVRGIDRSFRETTNAPQDAERVG